MPYWYGAAGGWGEPYWGVPYWGVPYWGAPYWGAPYWGVPYWGAAGAPHGDAGSGDGWV